MRLRVDVPDGDEDLCLERTLLGPADVGVVCRGRTNAPPLELHVPRISNACTDLQRLGTQIRPNPGPGNTQSRHVTTVDAVAPLPRIALLGWLQGQGNGVDAVAQVRGGPVALARENVPQM